MTRWVCRGGLLLLVAVGLASAAGPAPVNVIRVSGSINPASSDYIQRAIEQSEEEGARALVIELDTPGGLLSSTKDIIQAILNARVPVIVYVSPRGAWAASAGTFITMAGHVAAMAPGTSIGAAHPVGIGGGGGGGGEKDEEGAPRDFAAEKIENFTATFIESIARERKRNTEWAIKAVRESVSVGQDEALELNVIDLVAQNREDLFRQLEGREVQVEGETRTLELEGAPVHELQMSLINRFIDVLASPDVAVLLILGGLLGLWAELQQPGLIVPGVVGAVCLILGFIALQILPFSWLGLLLMLLGIAMLVAEVFVTSYGLLFAAGVSLFLLGGSMIFDMPAVSDLDVSFWNVLVPAASGLALFAGLVIYAVGRAFRRPQASGVGELVGIVGTAVTPLAPEGTVFVRGEHWNARAESPLAQGERVEVTAVRDLTLRVRRARPSD